MTAEEEVVLCGMGDVGVHSRPCRHVASPAGLVALVRAEESGVMPFLHCNQGDPWHVVRLQLQEDWLRSRRIFVQMLEAGTLTQASRIARSSTWSTLLNCPSHTPSLRRRNFSSTQICLFSLPFCLLGLLLGFLLL